MCVCVKGTTKDVCEINKNHLRFPEKFQGFSTLL